MPWTAVICAASPSTTRAARSASRLSRPRSLKNATSPVVVERRTATTADVRSVTYPRLEFETVPIDDIEPLHRPDVPKQPSSSADVTHGATEGDTPYNFATWGPSPAHASALAPSEDFNEMVSANHGFSEGSLVDGSGNVLLHGVFLRASDELAARMRQNNDVGPYRIGAISFSPLRVDQTVRFEA